MENLSSRSLSADANKEYQALDRTLRPKTFQDYIGQEKVKKEYSNHYRSSAKKERAD